MLFSREIIETLADKLAANDKKMLVLDPVMVAKGGSRLIGEDAIATLVERLMPLAFLVTPNVPEAEALTGVTIVDEESMLQAAQVLIAMGARNVLIKGGHLPGRESVDILFDSGGFRRFSAARIATCNTHGTGCSYASAIAAFLAQGEPLPLAVARSKEFITTAISLAVPLGGGHGPVNHFAAAHKIMGYKG
jgi:hydroxymethylpyrimidine kinase/phosphomethylpyrimidine kinase/thiamine-phosphate diphosphorylase